MTTYYTITGRSTTRPDNLPDGFEVAETKDRLNATIVGENSDAIHLFETLSGDLEISISGGYELFDRDSVQFISNLLVEYLDSGETYDDPNVQPDFSLTLVCPEGYTLRHDTDSRGHWSRYDGDEWQGWDRWSNYVASYGPWKVQR